MKTVTKVTSSRPLILALLFGSLLSASGYAAETYRLNMAITGVVTATGQCLFVSPSQQVDLGDIIVSRPFISTNTRHYQLVGENRADLDIKMKCTGDALGKTKMTLRGVMGEVQSQDGRRLLQLKNTKDGSLNGSLAIGLLVDGIKQDVGTSFVVDMNSQPKVEVEIVQIADGATGNVANDFSDGDSVESAATLVMEFE